MGCMWLFYCELPPLCGGKCHQPAHPKNVNHAAINAHFQLVYVNLMGPFKSMVHGETKLVSNTNDQVTKSTAVYLLCSTNQALASLQLIVT